MSENQFAEGSPEQLDDMIVRRSRAALGYRADDREDFAEEVRGTARVKAVAKLPTVNGLRSREAWVTTVVRTTAIDAWRELQRRRKHETSIADVEARVMQTPVNHPSPEQQMLDRERDAPVREAYALLKRKNARHAGILWLKDVEEWTAAEIAAVERTSVDNINHIVHRARKRLRGLVESLLPCARGSPSFRKRSSRVGGLRPLRPSYPGRRERHWLM